VGIVANFTELDAHGMQIPRGIALELVQVGLAVLDPFSAVKGEVHLSRDQLHVGRRVYDLSEIEHIYVVGAGKASLRIAEALEELLGDRITDGVVVVRRGQRGCLSRIRTWEADHPIPSERSQRGAQLLFEVANRAGAGDLVFVCVTGGSSALACYPPAGVSLTEKQEVHRLLLQSGANILEINAVRKHVSEIKGGRLARRIAPAKIVNLTISDVAGDPLDYITDLTVPDTSTVADAIQVLHRYHLWDRMPESVRQHLLQGEKAESPDLSEVDIYTLMLATGDTACEAMARRAAELGLRSLVLSTFLEGESREAGIVLATIAKEVVRKGRPITPPCVLLGCGGETTVTLEGNFGTGGPNQELVLGAALKLEPDEPVAIAAVDTDGADGGTEFAGGLVDGLTRRRLEEKGIDLRTVLTDHLASYALRELGDLIITGQTHTNVNDMFVVAVVPENFTFRK